MKNTTVIENFVKIDTVVVDVQDIRHLVATSSPLGKGSARRVVSLGNGLAIKIAMNQKGIMQNTVENELHDEPIHQHYFNKVHWISEDSKYMIVDELSKVKHIAHVKNWVKAKDEDIWEDLLHELVDYYNLMSGDLKRPSSWGMDKEGNYKLIDYGFTEEVYDLYQSIAKEKRAKREIDVQNYINRMY